MKKNVHPIHMKVAFIFIVKDGEKYLEPNLNLLKRHGHDIYAVENNSVDDTKNILKRADIKKVITLDLDDKSSLELCGLGEVNCAKRVRRLAYIRQQGLDAVMNADEAYDYVCMLDMDFESYDPSHLDGMFEFMENNKDVDALFGMSVVKHMGIPYDISAVRPMTKLPTIGLKLKQHVKVQSAFSGFGIYRCSSIVDKNAKYDYKTIDDIEHVHFNKHFEHLVVDTKFNPSYEPSDKLFNVKMAVVISLLAYFLIRVFQRFRNNKR